MNNFPWVQFSPKNFNSQAAAARFKSIEINSPSTISFSKHHTLQPTSTRPLPFLSLQIPSFPIRHVEAIYSVLTAGLKTASLQSEDKKRKNRAGQELTFKIWYDPFQVSVDRGIRHFWGAIVYYVWETGCRVPLPQQGEVFLRRSPASKQIPN